MQLADNYLNAEQLIIDRLAQELPQLTAVVGAERAEDALEGGIACPFAVVVFAGDRVLTGDDAVQQYGVVQVVWQRWLVEIVSDMAGVQGGTLSREEPGQLMSQALRALQGWHPSDEHSEVYRVQGPAPIYQKGQGVFPLLFETMVITS
jgi:hypothetical protein